MVYPRERQVECELVAVEHMEHWDVLEDVDVWQRMQLLGILGILGIREESSQMRCVETGIRWLKTSNCDCIAMGGPYPSRLSLMPTLPTIVIVETRSFAGVLGSRVLLNDTAGKLAVGRDAGRRRGG